MAVPGRGLGQLEGPQPYSYFTPPIPAEATSLILTTSGWHKGWQGKEAVLLSQAGAKC